MPPRQAPAPKPKRFRVLWEDSTGLGGRYEDVDAASESEAVWKVAISYDGGTFAGAYSIPATAED